jgi:hypothetical protein
VDVIVADAKLSLALHRCIQTTVCELRAEDVIGSAGLRLSANCHGGLFRAPQTLVVESDNNRLQKLKPVE